VRRLLRAALLALGLGAPAGSLPAQVSEGNRFWTEGRFAEAKAAYETELRGNPGSVRSLYRLAVLASWEDRLDSAATLAARARTLEPADPDVRALQAQLDAWTGRFGAAVARYDSVIADHPERAGLVYDRARAYAWSRPAVEASAGWNNDSDENRTWWQRVGLSAPLGDRVRAFAAVGAQQSSDPVREADRLLAEAGMRATFGRMSATLAGGARRLDAGSGRRIEPAARAVVDLRFAPRSSLTASYTHHPFDETAQLIGSGIDIDALDGSVDLGVARSLTLSAGGGGAWFSDGNDRWSVHVAATQTVARHFFVGAMVRQTGYEFRGTGYFSPDRFRLAEGRAGWTYRSAGWTARLSGGLGAQQAFRGADAQAEWHGEARLARGWGAAGVDGSVLEVFGGISNSLESSASGAFRYRHAGVRISIGL
jgi:tetratricopeptide (TPR) repeat protein